MARMRRAREIRLQLTQNIRPIDARTRSGPDFLGSDLRVCLACSTATRRRR